MAAHWQQNYQIYRKYLENIVVLYQRRQDIRIYTELLLNLISVIIFSIFAIRPTFVTVAELYKSRQDKLNTIKTMDQKISNLVAAEAVFDQEKEYILVLNLAIPENPLPGSLIRQIEGISHQNTVSLENLILSNAPIIGTAPPPTAKSSSQSTTAPPVPENASVVPVSINITGNYFSLLAFLRDIESMRRPLYLHKLDLSTLDEENLSTLRLTLDGQITYLR